jgi:hypothetical protein
MRSIVCENVIYRNIFIRMNMIIIDDGYWMEEVTIRSTKYMFVSHRLTHLENFDKINKS